MMYENPQRYPIGLQDFPEIREKGCLYVDKTALVHRMANGPSKYVFLSRPRRFGKSLLVSTLQAYFEGRKDLFKGLAIEGQETEWAKYPVISIDLAFIKDASVDRLGKGLDKSLREYENVYGRDERDVYPGDRLDSLVKNAYRQSGKGVVLLIDEYDTPLIEAMHDEEILPRIRTIMRDFYAPLKGLDPYLRFVYLTGITKFSHLGMLSVLNNIDKISLDEEYAAVCGITEHEMLACMRPGIEWLAQKNGIQYDDAVDRLKATYDGYHFTWPSPDIYNPYSLMNALSDGEFNNYWFETGTPAYLVQMLHGFSTRPEGIGGKYFATTSFDSPTEAVKSATPLLYQSGYLTIVDRDPNGTYLLDIPNEEVRVGLMGSLLPEYVEPAGSEDGLVMSKKLRTLMVDGKIDEALKAVQSYLAGISYTKGKYGEGHFQSLLYVIFSLTGFRVKTERVTAEGRIDLVVRTADTVYIFELKNGKSVSSAMEQIEEKGYADGYKFLGHKVVKVGVKFDPKKRNIVDWVVK